MGTTYSVTIPSLPTGVDSPVNSHIHFGEDTAVYDMGDVVHGLSQLYIDSQNAVLTAASETAFDNALDTALDNFHDAIKRITEDDERRKGALSEEFAKQQAKFDAQQVAFRAAQKKAREYEEEAQKKLKQLDVVYDHELTLTQRTNELEKQLAEEAAAVHAATKALDDAIERYKSENDFQRCGGIPVISDIICALEGLIFNVIKMIFFILVVFVVGDWVITRAPGLLSKCKRHATRAHNEGSRETPATDGRASVSLEMQPLVRQGQRRGVTT